jgi:glyoxylase-like metal-dependent hydrolase (beta-lactamase superfamily II)
MRIGPSLHRLGEDIVNCYLIEEAGRVTVVDAGVPAYYEEIAAELGAMGRTIDDVDALVLTHGHSDHIGFAERLRVENSVPVTVHELDAALARGEVKNPSAGTGKSSLMPFTRFLVWSARRGALRQKKLVEVSTFEAGATLDVPGAPAIVHTPGHTPGSVSLHVPSADALLVGDAMAMYSPTTGAAGPQIAAFSADPDEALASLAAIEGLEARHVLPGHGQPFDGGVQQAIELARQFGIDHLARP